MMPMVAALAVGLGLFAAVVALRRRDQRSVGNLRELLEASYLDERPTLTSEETSSLLARTGIAAEEALKGTGLVASMRAVIDHSDWTVTAGEFLVISLVTGLTGTLLGLVSGAPAFALMAGLLGIVGPYLLVRRSVRKRTARFEDQFPAVLDIMASSLESGAGVSQALELVVAESPEPTATEFARVLASTRLGVPLVEALSSMADRLGSRDLRWTVQAIIVQQTTGGRLAEVLRIVSDLMRNREELRREISALTAEGRLSAYILGGLPFCVLGFLALVRPEYISPLFTTAAGLAMLAAAGVMILGSFVVMFRIIKIEV